jgi:predicted RNA-binding protein YlxR (DUF448 family)
MGMSKGHTPIRTCISCGEKKNKNQLIRLTLNDEGKLVRDFSGRMPGRGAYICELPICMEKLFKNRRLNKIFRTDRVITISSDIRE